MCTIVIPICQMRKLRHSEACDFPRVTQLICSRARFLTQATWHQKPPCHHPLTSRVLLVTNPGPLSTITGPLRHQALALQLGAPEDSVLTLYQPYITGRHGFKCSSITGSPPQSVWLRRSGVGPRPLRCAQGGVCCSSKSTGLGTESSSSWFSNLQLP